MSTSMEKEVDRILTLLRNKIRERGYTQLEVQDQLNWGRSYISQLLTKQKSLRVEQVLMILETIKVEPKDFYAELYRFPRPDVQMRNLDDYPDPTFNDYPLAGNFLPESGTELDPYPGDFLRSYRELRSLVHGLIQVLVDKEVLAPDEVISAARQAEPDWDDTIR